MSWALSVRVPAAMLSSRWVSEPMRGMGSRFGERASNQASATWGAWSPRGGRLRRADLGGDRLEAAAREEGDVGDAGLCAGVDERVAVASGEVVEVRDAGNRCDLAGLGELGGGDVEMPRRPIG